MSRVCVKASQAQGRRRLLKNTDCIDCPAFSFLFLFLFSFFHFFILTFWKVKGASQNWPRGADAGVPSRAARTPVSRPAPLELLDRVREQVQALIRSQAGPGAGAALSVVPTNLETTIPPHFFPTHPNPPRPTPTHPGPTPDPPHPTPNTPNT